MLHEAKSFAISVAETLNYDVPFKLLLMENRKRVLNRRSESKISINYYLICAIMRDFSKLENFQLCFSCHERINKEIFRMINSKAFRTSEACSNRVLV